MMKKIIHKQVDDYLKKLKKQIEKAINKNKTSLLIKLPSDIITRGIVLSILEEEGFEVKFELDWLLRERYRIFW